MHKSCCFFVLDASHSPSILSELCRLFLLAFIALILQYKSLAQRWKNPMIFNWEIAVAIVNMLRM